MAKQGIEWTEEQLRLLKEYYSNTLTADLVDLIGRNENSIYHKAYKLGLKKSAEFLASPSSGRLNESPIGQEYIHHSGYLIRKVNNDLPYANRWKAVHVIEWEKHYGLVPTGYMVSFKDKDKTNIDIENLELVTRKQIYDRNTIHRLPKEIISLIFLHGRFKSTIKRRMKNET